MMEVKNVATQTKKSPVRTEPELEQQKTSGAKQTIQKDIQSLQAFFTKFNNDWVMNFAAGLAFNLITAIFPVVIAIISIVGFIFGGLDPTIKQDLLNNIQHVFPPPISSGNVLGPALTSLSKNAGFLAIIAVLIAIFGGSRLFVSIENYFDIIYHTRPRDV